MSFKPILLGLALALSPVALAPVAFADKPPVYTAKGSTVAVEGHDPVAYFTEGKPVKGSESFTTTYNGAQFRFASAANLAKFEADPEAYAPQYGGYCAWAIAQGKFAKGSADHWRIVDGKLYLNYDAGVQKKWLKDVPGFITKADAKWPEILTR